VPVRSAGDDRDVSAQMLAEPEQGLRSAFQSELRFRHKNGTMIWVHVSVSYVPATEVTPALFPAIIEDITQRKQAELERERLALIVEKSGDAMGFRDLDGIPLYLNKAGLRLVGFENMDELRERKGTHYVFPDDRPFINTVLWPSVLNKGSWSGEIRFRHFKTGKVVPVLYDGLVDVGRISLKIGDRHQITRLLDHGCKPAALELGAFALRNIDDDCAVEGGRVVGGWHKRRVHAGPYGLAIFVSVTFLDLVVPATARRKIGGFSRAPPCQWRLPTGIAASSP